MVTKSLRNKLVGTVGSVGHLFFQDPEEKQIGAKTAEHWNISLLALANVLNENALILGEPGFGKTTLAKVMSSTMTGLPFDLYETAQIQGHPDQTFETMIARLDFSKIHERESVIWLLSAYLDSRIVDEINRLPAGKQDELLNAMQTGRFSYLNSTFFKENTSFTATANHQDNGTNVMIPPLRDRFGIAIELGYIGATYRRDIALTGRNVRDRLVNRELTNRILEVVNDPSKTIPERLKEIENVRGEFASGLSSRLVQEYSGDDDEIFGVKYVDFNFGSYSPEDKKRIQDEIDAVAMNSDARMFCEMIDAELNTTTLYGRKRSSDRVDQSTHSVNLASSKVKNGFSPRGIRALDRMSRGIAYLLGDSKVQKEHVVAVAPHVLGHRLDFTDDYLGSLQELQRPGEYGIPLSMFAANQLVAAEKGSIAENYETVREDVTLVQHWRNPEKKKNLDRTQLARVEHLRVQKRMGHPLLQELVGRLGMRTKR
jgi:MoxR-like ATPase